MDNFAPKTDRGLRRRGSGLRGAALLALSLLLPLGGHAAEFEISADSFTVVNQVNISSVTYFSTRATAPPNPALATQLLTPGGLYFDATYYNVWDRTALAWVKLATGTVEAGRVAKAGDFMSGQLTTASTITVQGNAFSVGASTFVVIGGNVGIGTASPGYTLEVNGTFAALVPINAQTAAGYTLAASDNNKLLTMDNAGAVTVTIPANASVSIPVGFQCTIVQKGVGVVTLSKAGGVTVISTAASLAFNAKGSASTLVKVGTDEWLAYGDMQ